MCTSLRRCACCRHRQADCPPLLVAFQDHAAKVRDKARAKRESVALKHVVDDPELRDEAHDDAAPASGCRRALGDTALRTLNTLLAMVDQRGFERSAHQFDFTGSMIRCVVRVLSASTGRRRRR